MLVILDLQHRGKPGKNDLGASHDLNGDGVIQAHEREANLTPIYAAAARMVLERAGCEVEILQRGAYSTRHKRAAELASEARGLVAYVACHLNKGGGDYGLVCYDFRSGNGGTLATEIARMMRKRFAGEVRRVLTGAAAPEHRPAGIAGRRWDLLPKFDGAVMWPRPFATIRGIYAGPGNLSGVCFEPLFMDTHSDLCNEAGLERIGEALAAGLLAYFNKAGRK